MPRQKATCYDCALNLLARRGHAVKEIAGKLKQRGYEGYEIADTITRLEELNFLNDEKHALERAKYRAQFSKWGSARIKQELMQQGVAEGYITAALTELEAPADPQWDEAHDFTQTAKDLLAKKYKTPPQTPQEKKKQADFLLRRGFSYSQVKGALDAMQDERLRMKD